MQWQLSVQHRERLTHFLSVFSPSGRELIKEGLWFYLLSAPGLWVCVGVHVYVCVCASWMDFALSENVFSHTSLVGPCHFAQILPAALR